MWSPCQRMKGPRQTGAASPPVAAASICAPKQMPRIGRPAAASRPTISRCAAIQGMCVSWTPCGEPSSTTRSAARARGSSAGQGLAGEDGQRRPLRGEPGPEGALRRRLGIADDEDAPARDHAGWIPSRASRRRSICTKGRASATIQAFPITCPAR